MDSVGHSVARIKVYYLGKPEVTPIHQAQPGRNGHDVPDREAGGLLGNFCPKRIIQGNAGMLEILVHWEKLGLWNKVLL